MGVRDATNVYTSYVYDVHGNLTKVVGPGSGVTRTWMRAVGRTSPSETQPESGTTTYHYDTAGNFTQTTDANNQITTFQSYTPKSSQIEGCPRDDWTISRIPTTPPDASPDCKEVTPRRHSATTPEVYSPAAATPDQWDVRVELRLRQRRFPHISRVSIGRTVTYVAGTEHRLTSVSQNGAPFANSFTYNNAGRLASYQTGAVTHWFDYDLTDRPSRLRSVSGGGALDLTYTYDAVGNVQTIADPRPGATQDFTVNPLDRLVTADGPWGHLGW